MDKDIEAFRKEVRRWRGSRRRGARRYPDAMRSAALELWDRLRRAGVTREGAAKQVGISMVTLQQWRGGPGMKRLVPVQLIPEPRPRMATLPVRLLSPGGYRVEVPDVATAVALLRELG